ncbi:MAG: nucleotidyl transferase AbiEii/AbiGii toxin family protein [Opitutaceae bacterium]|nr:nucleotidyl transferase AbiEii/AbiGii toxin family protein [Opitutaceae bacterium]MBL4893324.1 nucleotidyl transferase AbiEii/AbiGii toxin family protein [Emcibacter sp.]
MQCDKLIALVNSTKYIRYRDLWDIAWLANTKNVTYDQKLAPLITCKITDYHIEDYGLSNTIMILITLLIA